MTVIPTTLATVVMTGLPIGGGTDGILLTSLNITKFGFAIRQNADFLYLAKLNRQYAKLNLSLVAAYFWKAEKIYECRAPGTVNDVGLQI